MPLPYNVYNSIKNSNYSVMDIKYIQTTKKHRCIRKLALQLATSELFVFEFRPCLSWKDLDNSVKRQFNYCKHRIHGLNYTCATHRKCIDAKELVNEILNWNGINLVLYKGGTIEKDLCAELNMPCFNLEQLGVPKAETHVPEDEIKFYSRCVKRLLFPNYQEQ